MNRRGFLGYAAVIPALCQFPFAVGGVLQNTNESAFARNLESGRRLLETDGYYVWGSSPIYDRDGRVHVFYSRWKAEYGMGGWIHKSEIARAVADRPEGPYTFQEVVLFPRGEGHWDGTTCHNPHINEVDGKYYLFYMGNSNRKTDTKRIGLAMANSLEGPWSRPDAPLLEAGEEGSWDDHCTTNPSFVRHPDGRCFLYYKSWNTYEYENYTNPKIRGNRKYGLAIAAHPEGPYKKYEGNPIIDYSDRGNNIQAEDGFVWYEEGKFKMLMRDMGIYNHQYGLYLESKDGINFPGQPRIAYYETDRYFRQPPKPKHLSKYGRFERPQILFKNGKPQYLFLASQGGKYMTSSAYLFKINN